MSKSSHIDKSIKKLDVLFRYSGLHIHNKIKSPMDMIKHRWLYTCNFLWELLANIASIYYMLLCIANEKDLIDVTSLAPCLTFSILGMMKSIFILTNEENIQKLLIILKDLEIKENDRPNSEDKEMIIAEEAGFLNKVINVLYVLNVSMIVVFDMIPIILIAVKYYKTKEFEMLLPYLDVFFIIPYELKYWPFAYIHQIWSECIVLLYMGAADYLFFTYCTHIRLQFRLLQYDLERIIPPRSISKDKIYVEAEFKDKFEELVKWHQDLIHSSSILETIYSKSTLFNFMLVICLTGFNITIVHDISVIITFLTFLFMALMQVFFLCFFADLLMRASIEVSSAVYNCQWYLANAGVCRQLLLVQIRAQKPCKLTAAGYADVNLNAFMRVLSKAWSYFALLQTVYAR